MIHVSDEQRRARLAVRHALAPAWRVESPVEVTRAMTVLHATEPATVYLSCWARTRSMAAGDVHQAVYRDRSLVKQLAMRRTLFVFPRDLLPAAWGSAAARVAGFEHTRMARDLTRAGITDDGDAWLDEARQRILAVLDPVPTGLTAAEIRAVVPMIDVRVPVSPQERWTASRVLTLLGATSELVHAENTGHWRTSRTRWALMRHWLHEPSTPLDPADGYRELVRRWLRSFGPGTEDDIVWWLGATRTAVRAALADLDAAAVSLDHGRTGWLLSDDLDPVPDPGPWVALLPVLDPTVMGWKEREFYLGPHRARLFDRSGNAGPTAWVDGRIVGDWVQDDAASVRVRLHEQVPGRAHRALDAEAARLTTWLDGVRIASALRFPGPSADPATATTG
jgi:hypothetical protein